MLGVLQVGSRPRPLVRDQGEVLTGNQLGSARVGSNPTVRAIVTGIGVVDPGVQVGGCAGDSPKSISKSSMIVYRYFFRDDKHSTYAFQNSVN